MALDSTTSSSCFYEIFNDYNSSFCTACPKCRPRAGLFKICIRFKILVENDFVEMRPTRLYQVKSTSTKTVELVLLDCVIADENTTDEYYLTILIKVIEKNDNHIQTIELNGGNNLYTDFASLLLLLMMIMAVMMMIMVMMMMKMAVMMMMKVAVVVT